MSDRVKLAREIAAPPAHQHQSKAKTREEGLAFAHAIAAQTKSRFISIPRERGGGKVQYTEEQLTVMRGGLAAEEYRGDPCTNEPGFMVALLRSNSVKAETSPQKISLVRSSKNDDLALRRWPIVICASALAFSGFLQSARFKDFFM